MKIEDVMTPEPRCVTPDTPVRDVARLMQSEGVGLIPVVESDAGQRLVGVVTDRDIAIRVVAEGRGPDTRVVDIMSGRLSTCSPAEDVDDALKTMAAEQVRRIPIVDERGSLVGIVAQADVVRKVNDEHKTQRTVESISQPGGSHTR